MIGYPVKIFLNFNLIIVIINNSISFFSNDQVLEENARNILKLVPDPLPIEPIAEKYPVKYEESMNTVLVQEVLRYNKLLSTIKSSLSDLLKAIKGLVVMSQQLETMSEKLFNNQVPELWASKVR